LGSKFVKLLYFNEFKHNILALVGNAKKKNENQNKSLQNKCLEFALKNGASNEFLLIIFHYLMSINYMKAFIGAHY
jgi:hypothetical protein